MCRELGPFLRTSFAYCYVEPMEHGGHAEFKADVYVGEECTGGSEPHSFAADGRCVQYGLNGASARFFCIPPEGYFGDDEEHVEMPSSVDKTQPCLHGGERDPESGCCGGGYHGYSDCPTGCISTWSVMGECGCSHCCGDTIEITDKCGQQDTCDSFLADSGQVFEGFTGIIEGGECTACVGVDILCFPKITTIDGCLPLMRQELQEEGLSIAVTGAAENMDGRLVIQCDDSQQSGFPGQPWDDRDGGPPGDQHSHTDGGDQHSHTDGGDQHSHTDGGCESLPSDHPLAWWPSEAMAQGLKASACGAEGSPPPPPPPE